MYPIILESWLSMRHDSKIWHKLFFVLTSQPQIEYYYDSKKLEKMGSLELDNVLIDSDPASRSYKPNCFELQDQEQIYLFSAPTQMLKQEWVEALTKCLQSKKNNSTNTNVTSNGNVNNNTNLGFNNPRDNESPQKSTILPEIATKQEDASSRILPLRSSAKILKIYSNDQKKTWSFAAGSFSKVSDCIKQIGIQMSYDINQMTLYAHDTITKLGNFISFFFFAWKSIETEDARKNFL